MRRSVPKEIRLEFIARLNRDYLKASLHKEKQTEAGGRDLTPEAGRA